LDPEAVLHLGFQDAGNASDPALQAVDLACKGVDPAVDLACEAVDPAVEPAF